MRARLFVFAVAVLFAACGSVLFGKSNAFPCDFGAPQGERDTACSAGDVCGTDNLCHPFVYEGPRFEGPPTLPDFSADAGAGRVIHPLVMDQPIELVARDPLKGTLVGAFKTKPGSPARAFHLDGTGVVRSLTVSSMLPLLTLEDVDALGIDQTSVGYFLRNRVVHTGTLGVASDGTPTSLALELPLPGVPAAQRLKTVVGASPLGFFSRVLVIPADGRRLGVLVPGSGPRPAFFPLQSDGGFDDVVLDATFVLRPRFASVLVAGRNTLSLLRPDGGFAPATTEELDFGKEAVLKADSSNTVFSVLFDARPLDPLARPGSLSTWQLQKSGDSWGLSRLWADCQPCADLTSPVAFMPALVQGVPGVDVVCVRTLGPSMLSSAVHVAGSTAADALQRCAVTPGELPFDSRRVMVRSRGALVQDESMSSGGLLGGRAGELWGGADLATFAPLWLDRVPDDVGLFDSPAEGGAARLAALTDRYVAVYNDRPGHNGFERLTVPPSLSTQVAARPLGLVHDGRGWLVNQTGDLVRLAGSAPDGGAVEVGAAFGPRLVDGQGRGVTAVLFGEGITQLDGGLVSMLIASGDSLYFVPVPKDPGREPGQLDPVTPQLTPEPGTTIRSLALERTPIGTNGVDRVRGYAVTSRSVFVTQLAGSPPRWSATPLPLAGGEPVEVWMDNPRGGLARVGYRDGRVFTLPGGFQLAEALPSLDGGEPPRVDDYANLGGWPIAYASTGLFSAQWGRTESGALDNRFPDGGVNKPMSWGPVTLPDGTTPWLVKRDNVTRVRPGRLHVIEEPQQVTTTPEGATVYKQTFRLLLFLDDKVLEVGRHVRSNKSVVVP